MRGFRSTAPVAQQGSQSGTGTGNAPASATPERKSTPLVAQIVRELGEGNTASMVAKNHGLPVDFVEMILERATEQGSLEFFELKPGSCTKGSCDPDPESLVCAGCPIMPAAIRRKQSLMGHLLHRD